MKERFFDVIKWGLILVIAGGVFYVVCPKYVFLERGIMRCNEITGVVEVQKRSGSGKFETYIK